MASFERIGQHINPHALGSTTGVEHKEVDSRLESGEVQKSQDKLKFALVDSGMGGGMTAALLRGEVRQLGSYFCLPIGDKQPNIATAYTAAMALWPMIAPLANSKGENDGRIAEHVIIACNSASVRRDGALDLMKEFCAEVFWDPDKYDINPEIKQNICELHEAIRDNENYLENRVHEIVSLTAKKGVEQVQTLIHPEGAEGTGKSEVFVRIDSTNGTVQSGAYLSNFERELGKYADGKVKVQVHEKPTTDTKTDPHIKLHVFTYTDRKEGEEKTVIVENRGDPLWVPDIEGNKIGKTGEDLARAANEASKEAWKGFEGLSGGVLAKLEGNKPDVSMMCCTHYPAMKGALEKVYGEGVSFINQATIVRDIVGDIDEALLSPERGALDLALTVGSQNYGGTPGNLKPSIADGNATAGTLFNVLDMTLGGSHLEGNDWREIGSVQVFQQGRPGEPAKVNPSDISFLKAEGVLQQQFELIHQFIGRPMADKILGEQGLRRADDGTLERITHAKNDIEAKGLENFPVAKPRIDHDPRVEELIGWIEDDVSEKLDKLGVLTTKGEGRGIDKLALFNDQGAQLRASIAQIAAVKERNAELPMENRERIGILTGFSVIDNESGARVGGENDGPPGAVIMARTLLLQGLPVTMVTDNSNEASLVAALIGAGLVELNVAGELKAADQRTLMDVTIASKLPDGTDIEPGQLSFEVPKRDNRDTFLSEAVSERPRINKERREEDKAAILESVNTLNNTRVTTMISIERPSVTESDGGLYSMLGLDVSPFNLDMSPMLGDESVGYKPFTIGIGDGGNELGTGGVQKITSGGRDEELQPFVKRGEFIAANKGLATDVMLLSTVSNNGGVTLSMALDLGLENLQESTYHSMASRDEHDQRSALERRFDSTIEAYNAIIQNMYDTRYVGRDDRGHTVELGMSLDGVNKRNLMTVDGRRLGTVEGAEKRFTEYEERGEEVPLGVGPTGAEGADTDTTHNDTFLKFKHTLLS